MEAFRCILCCSYGSALPPLSAGTCLWPVARFRSSSWPESSPWPDFSIWSNFSPWLNFSLRTDSSPWARFEPMAWAEPIAIAWTAKDF